MKIKYLFAIVFLFIGTTGFSQSGILDKEMKEGISELSEMLETLDLNKLLNEDLFAEIEKMKPSEEQIGEMQSMMEQSLKAVEKIDFSAFENLLKELETAIDEIKFPTSPDKSSKIKSTKPSKGKRI